MPMKQSYKSSAYADPSSSSPPIPADAQAPPMQADSNVPKPNNEQNLLVMDEELLRMFKQLHALSTAIDARIKMLGEKLQPPVGESTSGEAKMVQGTTEQLTTPNEKGMSDTETKNSFYASDDKHSNGGGGEPVKMDPSKKAMVAKPKNKKEQLSTSFYCG